jgi:dTDP-4-amino-4,6-dideoxygalactose transaminase
MSLISEKITAYKIPFSPPYIDEDVIAEVTDTLRSGWITTGPKVKQLELASKKLLGVSKTVCINSWTSGANLVFKWLGIGPGDEVIIPAYTYAATALAVLHTGAKPVMVDVLNDFTINPKKIQQAITPNTKAILTVDLGGLPCDYDAINEVVSSAQVKNGFTAANPVQQKFGRPVVIADAAHSLGTLYNDKPAAQAADITIFSLHAVKNITTAEGGIIAFTLPEPFDNEEEYQWMKINSLNGQTKDAFSKNKTGQWRYDIVSDGLKINMPDVCAAIGLAQLRKYPGMLLPQRKTVFDHYASLLCNKDWAIIPISSDEKRVSSFHLFTLRINNITETQRDQIIQKLADEDIATNVHFVPLPMLSLFKGLGYRIEDYPVSYANYANEISLPIYPQLTYDQCVYIIEKLEKAYYGVI